MKKLNDTQKEFLKWLWSLEKESQRCKRLIILKARRW